MKCMVLFTASIHCLAIYLRDKAKYMSIFSGPPEPLKQSSGPGLDINPDIFFLQKKIQAYSGEKKTNIDCQIILKPSDICALSTEITGR